MIRKIQMIEISWQQLLRCVLDGALTKTVRIEFPYTKANSDYSERKGWIVEVIDGPNGHLLRMETPNGLRDFLLKRIGIPIRILGTRRVQEAIHGCESNIHT